MKMQTKKLTLWIGALAIAAFAPLAQAAFTNGDFEDGSLSGWTPTVAGGCLVTNPGFGRALSNGSAQFTCEVAGTASLSQPLDFLSSPSGFDVGFWVALISLGAGNSFLVNSTDVSSLISDSTDADGFQHYSVQQLTGDLTFTISAAGSGVVFLDDVTVAAIQAPCTGRNCINVPEPGTLLLVGAALTVGAAVRRRKQA